jgi:hypothetical protein
MQVFLTISFVMSLLACESATGISQRSMTESGNASRISQDSLPPEPKADAELQLPWLGIVPEKAILTTQRTIHNITLIDSDMSMATELPFGLLRLTEASAKVGKRQTQTGFEVVSEDHAYLMVDNSSQLFSDGERTTIINKVLTNGMLKAELIQLLDQLVQDDPDYAATHIPSITILTDGDIPPADQQELASYFSQHFPDGQIYLHLIASPDVAVASDWCQPEARPEQWLLLREQVPKGLRLSLCDADWYGHFRSIGKLVIYDHAVVRMTLPSDSVAPGLKPYIKFNQRTFPADLMQYDSGSRQLQIRLVDMPANIQTIDIGFQP